MNDYSLLRKINPDELVVGIKVLDVDLGLCEFVAGPDHEGDVCLRYTCPYAGRESLFICGVSELRLPPLAWLEGKPVYKGETLFRGSVWVRVVSVLNERTLAVETLTGHVGQFASLSELTWELPKKKTKRKGWINLYKSRDPNTPVATGLWGTREAADDLAQRTSSERLACLEVDWEE